MAGITYDLALMAAIAFLGHLVIIPDFLSYTTSTGFPFSTVFATLYYKDILNGSFSYRVSCYEKTCASVTGPTVINNVCLQPIVNGPCYPTYTLNWLFIFYISFVVVEAVIMLIWWAVYKSQFGDRFTQKLSLRRFTIVVLVMIVVLDCALLVETVLFPYMNGVGTGQIATTFVIRLFSVILIAISTFNQLPTGVVQTVPDVSANNPLGQHAQQNYQTL